ncbi:hypothetical protein P5673_001438 [Acropora cervicornis]|uniref:Uncharacterized protein n=1 Tax=Acropora cervicornis TaxID=6130 RepID=A0AAD9R610_ACRCE|nr:hypothetical protein P5673_001438 [Acropora cervicornis]
MMVKAYWDYPEVISERWKKQWQRLKKATEEGKVMFTVDNYYSDSLLGCLRYESMDCPMIVVLSKTKHNKRKDTGDSINGTRLRN